MPPTKSTSGPLVSTAPLLEAYRAVRDGGTLERETFAGRLRRTPPTPDEVDGLIALGIHPGIIPPYEWFTQLTDCALTHQVASERYIGWLLVAPQPGYAMYAAPIRLAAAALDPDANQAAHALELLTACATVPPQQRTATERVAMRLRTETVDQVRARGGSHSPVLQAWLAARLAASAQGDAPLDGAALSAASAAVRAGDAAVGEAVQWAARVPVPPYRRAMGGLGPRDALELLRAILETPELAVPFARAVWERPLTAQQRLTLLLHTDMDSGPWWADTGFMNTALAAIAEAVPTARGGLDENMWAWARTPLWNGLLIAAPAAWLGALLATYPGLTSLRGGPEPDDAMADVGSGWDCSRAGSRPARSSSRPTPWCRSSRPHTPRCGPGSQTISRHSPSRQTRARSHQRRDRPARQRPLRRRRAAAPADRRPVAPRAAGRRCVRQSGVGVTGPACAPGYPPRVRCRAPGRGPRSTPSPSRNCP